MTRVLANAALHFVVLLIVILLALSACARSSSDYWGGLANGVRKGASE